jgi:hypothetical protein
MNLHDTGLCMFPDTCTKNKSVRSLLWISKKKKKKQKVLGGNGTRCSQAVTHPSTDRARRCLTSVIGREPVLFNVVWPLP